MTTFVFVATCSALVFANLALWRSILRPERRLWPPPEATSEDGWMTRCLRVANAIAVFGAFVTGPLGWESLALPFAVRAVGAVLFASGGAFALWGYFGLGVHASQGHYEGLVAEGPYRFSRNPQYVGTIVCVLGHALACASAPTLAVWALWTAWFVAAPFAEEPWMRAHLGHAWDAYAARVPRYFGWPRAGSAEPGNP